MIFRQITHDDLGCGSYLIGDEKAGLAAVVDPRLEIDEYLELARYLGVEITDIFETHNHADHVSGHGRLKLATGATIHIHEEAGVTYEHEPFADGDEFSLGTLTVRAVHTPGHRPEHTAFLLIDNRRGPEPWAVLTGDSLFIGDTARPDLAIEKREGARGIFHSLQKRLLTLAPETEVWPGHLGGSLCGGPGMDLKISSTIGYEARHNSLLSDADEEGFTEQTTAGLGPQPPNFQAIVDLNKGPLVTDMKELVPLTSRQVDQKHREGALIVDVRTDRQFDEAHIPGAVSISALQAGFGTKLAWIADRNQEVVFVGRDDSDANRAAKLAQAVGITKLVGFLWGGMTSWRQEKRVVERVARITVDELYAQTQVNPQLQILDVREQSEWDAGHIPESIHTPYHDLHSLPPEIDPHKTTAVMCASGQRAGVAASLAKRHGVGEVLHVVEGGVPAWESHGYPVQKPDPVKSA
jgi:glyoxylase-like metal-dependent hydrolase (beta-lactamase superfamily II)/rhodanese-related sulfurtransferase